MLDIILRRYIYVNFLIAWLGLLWFSFGIGTAILHRLQGNSFERVGDRFIISIWLGIIVISIALLTVSLFLPLSSIFSLVTILFISLVAVFYKKSINCNNFLPNKLPPPSILFYTTLPLLLTKSPIGIEEPTYHLL